jgi:hypothetical protein
MTHELETRNQPIQKKKNPLDKRQKNHDLRGNSSWIARPYLSTTLPGNLLEF